MARPLLLDLFCGAGGAAVGYHRAGFDVVGVDIAPQPDFPFKFGQWDALAYLEMVVDARGLYGRPFAVIHASPPCQHHTTLAKGNNNNQDAHPDLISPTRELLRATGLPYVIENVPSAPLHDPITLCGEMFGLDVIRHRLFESNTFPCPNERVNPDGRKSLSPQQRERKRQLQRERRSKAREAAA